MNCKKIFLIITFIGVFFVSGFSHAQEKMRDLSLTATEKKQTREDLRVGDYWALSV